MFRFLSCSCQTTSRPILRSKWTTTSSTSKLFFPLCFTIHRKLSNVFVHSISQNVTCDVLISSVCALRENMPSHFKFKEYCPLVFRNLRERFGIDDQDFLVRHKDRQATSLPLLGQISSFFLSLCTNQLSYNHIHFLYQINSTMGYC